MQNPKVRSSTSKASLNSKGLNNVVKNNNMNSSYSKLPKENAKSGQQTPRAEKTTKR